MVGLIIFPPLLPGIDSAIVREGDIRVVGYSTPLSQ
jgi:hypothetical protein